MAYNAYETTVAELAQAAYGRALEASGVNHYATLLAAGTQTETEILEEFMSNTEAGIRYPETQEHADTVQQVFQNVLGRDAAQAGVDFYVLRLEAGLTLSELVAEVLADAKGLSGGDAEYINGIVEGYGEDYTTPEPVDPSTPGETFNLTVNQDDLDGTSGNDTFKAHIFDNQNTAQSGDMIDGGAGTDRLEADIGNSQDFAIRLDTTSVEQFAVSAQDSTQTDDSDNNMNDNVQIDAERMEGTNWYESNNSRADLVIEDVRIERTEAYGDDSNQITRDITVAMVSTDPGDVDLDVYFDQHSLVREGVNTANSITLSVSNQVEASDYNAAAPLTDIPYTNVKFMVDDKEVTLDLDLTSVTTYAQMWTVIEAAFIAEQTANPLLANVTIARSVGTDTFFSKDGIARVADEYVLSISNGAITPATIGWYADGGLPSTNAFGANVLVGDTTSTSNLITATVVLDDVGRGSMGGDLVIGGLSTGETSDSQGVEQFDIFVDRNSELQNITSTDNTLQEVYVTNRDHFADKNSTATGSLTVTGIVGAGTLNAGAVDDEDGGVLTIDGYGFNDLRVFDASAMVGDVNINAMLSNAVVAKYMDLDDTATDVAADNAMFEYTLGEGNDTLLLDIDSANLEVAGTGTREDFELAVNAGNGDDSITVEIGNWLAPGGVFALTPANDGTNWYENQKENANISIDAGTGNDMIHTAGAGDVAINAGSGNDTVYTNNDGINPAASARTAEVQTLIFGETGDLNTQGQVTVTLSNGQSFTTVGLTTAGVGTSSNVDVATAVNAAFVAAAGAAGVAAGAAAGATAGLLAAYTAAVGTPGEAAALAAYNANLALVTSTAQIVADYAAITLVQTGNQIELTYGAGYSGPEDVPAAVISDIATDSTYTMAGLVDAAGTTSTFVAGTQEVITITTTLDAAAGDTLTFNDGTPVLTLVDTDGNGSVSPYEITQQLAATTFTLFDVTASNPSLGTVELTAKAAAAPSGLTVVDSGGSNATPAVTTVGVLPVAETGTGGSTQSFTVDIGADRSGTVSLSLDTDLDGVLEVYDIAITAGDESSVATQMAAFINTLPTMTAVAADAGGVSTVTMTYGAIGAASTDAVAAAATIEDGAIVSSSVVETVKGVEADGADNATWVVNATNTDITDLDSAGAGANALLLGAQLTVTYSGANIAGASGVTSGAAVANTNGFESTVTIGTESSVGNATNINQAIKNAIVGDGVEGGAADADILEELLTVNDGPANTIVIESLIDGQFNVDDLAITITAANYADMTVGQKANVLSAFRDMMNDSTLTIASDAAGQAILDAAVATYTTAGALTNFAQGTNAAGALLRGEASNTVSDNVITLGTGDDVVVLGTDDQSNDTLVYAGSNNGHDTVVNFTQAGAAMDMIDFSAFLNAQTSASGSAGSAVDVAITLNTDATAEANSVTVINNFAQAVGETWAGLTAANLFAALNNDGTEDWGSIDETDLNAVNVANLVGTTYNHIVMVENDQNDGEYKVFNLTTVDGDDFSGATLVGTIDFGNTLASVSDATFA